MTASSAADSRTWIFAGGAGLALLAGYVNAVGILATFHTVSHLSGTVSNVAIDLVVPGREAQAWPFVVILVSFVLGATTCGLTIGGRALAPGRRYGVALLFESAALTFAAYLLGHHPLLSSACMAFAMGMQNALATTYQGLIIRTTHLTGIVTDLGVMLGHLLRRQQVEGWRFALLGLLAVGFGAGSAIGAILFGWLGPTALWIPAGVTFAAGLGYFVWRSRRARSFWREWLLPG